MTLHAKLSASGAHRWMNCPGSVGLEEQFPDESSSYADEGTRAHKLADMFLERGLNADYDLSLYEDMIGEEPFTDDPEQVAEYLQTYLDYVRSFDGRHFGEQRVDFSPWVPDGFGTSDRMVLTDNHGRNIDLKYGAGIRVYADFNPQGMLYTLGAINEYGYLYENIEDFVITVAQPRMDHIDEWEVSRKDLLAWGEDEVKPAALLALSENPPFSPSEKTCQWCKAKDTCKARAEFLISQATIGFEKIGDALIPATSDALTLEEIAEVLPHLKDLKSWADSLSKYAYSHAMGGGTIPGHKLVEGRAPNRFWSDEEAAEKKLKRDPGAANAFTKKLISPSQAEKAYGKDKDKLQKLITKPSGKPTLVPASDKRPAIQIDTTEGFAAVA